MPDLKEIKKLLQSMIPGAPVPEDVWETRDGRRIHIVEMTDKHLVNTLLYLKRKCKAIITCKFTQMDVGRDFWRKIIPLSVKSKFLLMEAEAIKRGFTDWESKHPIRE